MGNSHVTPQFYGVVFNIKQSYSILIIPLKNTRLLPNKQRMYQTGYLLLLNLLHVSGNLNKL